MNYTLVVVLGRLVKDPEMRMAEGDLPCVNFSVAVNRKIKRRDGTVEDEANFVDVAMFGLRARAFAEHHGKGDHCLLQGRLQTDRWTDAKTGEPRQKLRVVAESWEFVGGQRRDATG